MPAVSERQRKAMFAAKAGHSNLGIPQKVGAEFAQADPGGKLPESAPKKMAAGGEAKKQVKDMGTHFHVSGAHGDFRIAKKGLHPRTVERIQAMCSGGAVKMAEGGEAPETLPDFSIKFDKDSGVPPEYQEAWQAGLQAAAQPPAPRTEGDGRGIVTPQGQPVSVPLPQGGRTTVNPATQEMPTVPSAPQQPVQPKALPGTIGPTQAQPPAAPPPGAGPPPATVVPTVHGPSSTEQQLADDQKAQLAAGAQNVDIEGKKKAAVYDAGVQWEKDRQTAFEQQQKSLSEVGQRLQQAVVDGQINPNKYWADRGTGGKITAGIGLALSGLGSGLTGQPNLALKVIQDNIQRDVEAQYKNQLNAQRGAELNLQQQQQGRADFYADLAMHQHIVLGQIQSAAALAQGPAAIANAKFLSDNLQVAIEQSKRQAADLNSRNWATAQTADRLNKWNYDNAQASGGGPPAVDKPIMDRVTLLTGVAGSAGKILDAADNRLAGGVTPGAFADVGQGVSSATGGGYRGGSNWDMTVELVSGELAKLAKGGVGGEAEIEALKKTAPGANASVAQKHSWIDHAREYLKGQKQNLNEQFGRQGHASYLPYPEVANAGAGTLATDTKK